MKFRRTHNYSGYFMLGKNRLEYLYICKLQVKIVFWITIKKYILYIK